MTGLVRADTALMLHAAQEMQRVSMAMLEQFAAAQQAMQNLQGSRWSGNHRLAIEERWSAINAQFQPTTSTLDDLARRLTRTAEALDAAALTFGDGAALGSPGSFLANLGTMLADMSPSELVMMGWAVSSPANLLAALPYTPWGQALLRAGHGSYPPELAATHTALPEDGPPPIYIYVNGIGSSTVNGDPDDSGKTLQKTFAAAGYDPNQLWLSPASYNTDLQTHYAAGDWWGLGPAINGVTQAFNLDVGVAEVFKEYVQGEDGKYTQQTMQWIKQKLDAHPLLPGQKVVLVGHSGGGAVVANLAPMLETENIDVQAVVTMGSPVANYDQAGQYAQIHQIRDHHDYIGLPIVRSAEGTDVMDTFNPLVSLVGSELLQRNANPNGTHTTTYSDSRVYDTVTGHTSYHANPVVAHMLGQYYGAANQPTTPACASASGAAR